MTTEHFHGVPPEMYDRLVGLFGEQRAADTDTVWVEFGAGTVQMVLFPARTPAEAERMLTGASA